MFCLTYPSVIVCSILLTCLSGIVCSIQLTCLSLCVLFNLPVCHCVFCLTYLSQCLSLCVLFNLPVCHCVLCLTYLSVIVCSIQLACLSSCVLFNLPVCHCVFRTRAQRKKTWETTWTWQCLSTTSLSFSSPATATSGWVPLTSW